MLLCFPGVLTVYLAASRPAQARATVANVCQKISEGPYRVGVGGAVQAGCALTVRNRPLGWLAGSSSWSWRKKEHEHIAV